MELPSSTVFQVQLNWESPPIFFYIRSGCTGYTSFYCRFYAGWTFLPSTPIAAGYLSFLYRLSIDYQLKLKEILTLYSSEDKRHIYSKLCIQFSNLLITGPLTFSNHHCKYTPPTWHSKTTTSLSNSCSSTLNLPKRISLSNLSKYLSMCIWFLFFFGSCLSDMVFV